MSSAFLLGNELSAKTETTRILQVASENPTVDEGQLRSAVDALNLGQVIAVPTDTVYGLVCRIDEENAINRLYAIKGRAADKALPILLGDQAQLPEVLDGALSSTVTGLIERFWPGPLTLVLPVRPHISRRLTAGGDTVAVRIPAHAGLRYLAQQVGPLASSSANRSNQPSCCTAEEVLAQLDGRIPLLVDGGPTAHAMASTVLLLAGNEATFLREGPIGEQVRAVLNIADDGK